MLRFYFWKFFSIWKRILQNPNTLHLYTISCVWYVSIKGASRMKNTHSILPLKFYFYTCFVQTLSIKIAYLSCFKVKGVCVVDLRTKWNIMYMFKALKLIWNIKIWHFWSKTNVAPLNPLFSKLNALFVKFLLTLHSKIEFVVYATLILATISNILAINCVGSRLYMESKRWIWR